MLVPATCDTVTSRGSGLGTSNGKIFVRIPSIILAGDALTVTDTLEPDAVLGLSIVTMFVP